MSVTTQAARGDHKSARHAEITPNTTAAIVIAAAVPPSSRSAVKWYIGMDKKAHARLMNTPYRLITSGYKYTLSMSTVPDIARGIYGTSQFTLELRNKLGRYFEAYVEKESQSFIPNWSE